MADNVDITAGAGTTVRTDDISGVQYPVSKIALGADGVDDGFVSAANPLPVTGTLAVTGAATEVTLGTRLAETTFTGRINTLGAKTSANSTPVVLAIDQASIPVAATCTGTVTVQDGGNVISVDDAGGTLTVDDGGTSLTVDGTVTANSATSHGKTITYVSIAQGAAGTTALAAASPGNKHKLLGLVVTMSLAGTVKLVDGASDVTGAMDVAASGGFVLPTSIIPYVVGTANTALNLVTTTGAAKGVAIILTEA